MFLSELDMRRRARYVADAIWHKPDRTHITREEYDKRLSEIFELDQWIIDGNYSRTIEKRLQMCDTAFLFDLPTSVCLQGAVSRLGEPRYDVPWIDHKLDPRLEKEIKEFSDKTLPGIYQLLDKYKENRQIVVFKSRTEADEYLNRLVIV